MSSHDDIADPELLARLSAWFGSGEPVVATTPSFTAPPQKSDKLAKIEKVADARLIDRLERGIDRNPASFAPRIDVAIDSSLPLFIPPGEPLDDDEPLEYWQPDDIRLALEEDNTPQAVLRDLFRPVTHFQLMLAPLEELDDLLVDGVAVVRQAVKEPLRAGRDALPTELIATDIGELREILARPWADSKPEKPTETVDLAESHGFWFGATGGYDPDL